jgi:hypothetical protein
MVVAVRRLLYIPLFHLVGCHSRGVVHPNMLLPAIHFLAAVGQLESGGLT